MLRYATTLLLTWVLPAPLVAQEPTLQFNRDIRPILSNNCFQCHGPDAKARKAGLRLDQRASATRAGKHGQAVVPGDPAASLLVRKIHHPDRRKRMPPAKSGKTLTAAQQALLERWIAEGASWQAHWSYEPLRQPPLPPGDARHPVDRFLQHRQRARGVPPAPPADPRTLVRRLHFDLLGLPPAAGAAQPASGDWYERLVDRLLQTGQHAERLTMYWLDLVRYADSCGIHGDQVIPMSPYRDYVIESFRTNKPFDVFTREQLAGDLLPDAGLTQQVASGYNRLNMKTAEGGAQEKEYLAKYAADRVRTTATVWLGATMGCCECHDHKFDPYRTRDFYRLAAFFADLDHKGFYAGANSNGDWGPKVRVPTPGQRRRIDDLQREIAAIERELVAPTPARQAAQQAWETRARQALVTARPPTLGPWRAIGPFPARSLRAAHDTAFGPERDPTAEQRHGDRGWEPRPRWRDGAVHRLTGSNCATYLFRTIDSPIAQSLALGLGSDDSIKVWLNGEPVLDRFVSRGAAKDQERVDLALRSGSNRLLLKVSNGGGDYGFYFAARRLGPPAAIAAILTRTAADRSPEQQARLAAYYRDVAPELAELRQRLAARRQALADFEKQVPTTLVSKVRAEPRVTRVLPRGNWLDESGEVVAPGVPEFLPQPPVADRRLTRLDLANWLTAPDNPLTARVFVNRLWKLLFGRGLAANLDDLGSQGAWPRHPELLDWLAAEFRKDWNVRRMVRLIVTSQAYRQSSDPTPAALARDPENLEFARQGRFRHDAEVIRDVALAASGLLDRRVGGPSVKPYQPADYWAQLNFPKRRWQHDTGPDQYRRGLYTHWQRTFLHPSLLAFDAPTREQCTAERMRSNTPLQALALLNDPTFVEAARALAARVLADAGPDRAGRLRNLFQRVLSRDPRPDETTVLGQLLDDQRQRYADEPAAAQALLGVGLAPVPADRDPVELAAWTAAARTLLNLHETITRY